jgi:hypothetical protein
MTPDGWEQTKTNSGMETRTATDKAQPTATRVERSTNPQINRRIHRESEAALARAAADPQSIEQRLRELDEEWNIERTLQTNFAVVNLLSITLGALVARPWFLLTGVAAGFMARHALQGWCPPVPIFRRLGYRTAGEMDQERYALKALRGDFEGIEPAKAFQAAGTERED